MLVKETPLTIYDGYLRPVKGQEAAPHGLAKYLNKPKAGSNGTNNWFVIDLETRSEFFNNNGKVVKVIFDDSPYGLKITQDLESGSARMVDDKGASVKPFQGRFVEIMYGALYDISFPDPTGKIVKASSKGSEMQFLFANESIINTTTATQKRIASQPDRYKRVEIAENQDDIDTALQTGLNEPA